MYRIAFWLLLSPLFHACTDSNYLAINKFEDGCWSVSDTISVKVDVKNLDQPSRLQIHLDLHQDYAYRNIFLKCIATSPEGVKTDTLLNDIFIDEKGYWKHPQKWNGIYSFPINQLLSIPTKETGTYNIDIVHYMRTDKLCHTHKIGIQLL